MLMAKYRGEIDAWDIRWGNTMYEHNGLCVRPCRSLLYNIGFDGTGVHSGSVSQEKILAMTAPLYDGQEYEFEFERNIKVKKAIIKSMRAFWDVPEESIYVQFKRQIKKRLHRIYNSAREIINNRHK